jgi:hypothetical protein
MKSRLSIWGTIILLCFFLGAATAGATPFLVYDEYGGDWADADKTDANDDDDLMCWAATASNMLYYSGWGQNFGFSDTDEIFSYFQDYWTDAGGNMVYAIDWWFNGTDPGENADYKGEGISYIYPYVKGPGSYNGGTFWAGESDYYLFYSDYYDDTIGKDDQFDALSYIDTLLNDGYGVGLSLSGPSGHAVTAWGYEYDDNGDYTGVYITDSDDGKDGLQYFDILYTGSYWYLQSYYGYDTYYISEVQGLTIMDGTYVTTAADTYATPEPATLTMFGLSLIVMSSWFRRRV